MEIFRYLGNLVTCLGWPIMYICIAQLFCIPAAEQIEKLDKKLLFKLVESEVENIVMYKSMNDDDSHRTNNQKSIDTHMDAWTVPKVMDPYQNTKYKKQVSMELSAPNHITQVNLSKHLEG